MSGHNLYVGFLLIAGVFFLYKLASTEMRIWKAWRIGIADEKRRVWQIGPDGTEYYSAHSEEEMREYYRSLGTDTYEEDVRDYFEEVTDLDTEFDFNDDGEMSRTTWRKLAESMPCPTQISTGYN